MAARTNYFLIRNIGSADGQHWHGVGQDFNNLPQNELKMNIGTWDCRLQDRTWIFGAW